MTSLKISGENIDVKLMHLQYITKDYAAMAFSDDQKMGKDLVFACSSGTGFWEVYAFWNPMNHTPPELLNKELFKNPSGYYVGEIVTCKYTLEKDVTVKGTLFDFRKGYHILLARGPAGAATLIKHNDKIASKYKFKYRTGRYIYNMYISTYNRLNYISIL